MLPAGLGDTSGPGADFGCSKVTLPVGDTHTRQHSYQTLGVLCSTHSPSHTPEEQDPPCHPCKCHTALRWPRRALFCSHFMGVPQQTHRQPRRHPQPPPPAPPAAPPVPRTAAGTVTSAGALPPEPALAPARRGVGPHGLQLPRLWATGPRGAAGAAGDRAAPQEITPRHGQLAAGRVCERAPTTLPALPPSFSIP